MKRKGIKTAISDDAVRIRPQKYADTEAKRKAIETAMAGNASSPSEDVKYTVTEEEILKQLYGL